MDLLLNYRQYRSFLINLLQLAREFQPIDMLYQTYQINSALLLISFSYLLRRIKRKILYRQSRLRPILQTVNTLIATNITVITVLVYYLEVNYVALYIIKKAAIYKNTLKRNIINLRLDLRLNIRIYSASLITALINI